jgi:glycosyltransferase involved in cell wall biosynthesis
VRVPHPHKVGILVDGFANYAGTADFIIAVTDAMERTKVERELVLVSQAPPAWYTPRQFARWLKRSAEALRSRKLPPSLFEFRDPTAMVRALESAGLPRMPLIVAGCGDKALTLVCAQEGIEALIPSIRSFASGFPVPWVGYIYDFQHRALPDNFSAREIRSRDHYFAEMLKNAPVVICNALAVKRDAERFVERIEAEMIALPFSAMPPPAWFDTDPAKVRLKYGIGARYFIISNQFWIHKRHDLAFAAFAELAKQDLQIELVCSGSTEDWRAPGHLARLMQILEVAGVQGRVHILGMVGKSEQIALMRGSVAVIQPTSFEGGPGGGSVFDAVALGVPTLVSDIPVNREIEEFVTLFFELGDPATLLDGMRAILDRQPLLADRDTLLATGMARREAMGRALWYAADRAFSIYAGI